MAIGANAYDVDDFIYTRSLKFKVTAANLVTNGELKGASLDGWTATDATSAGLSDVFTVLDGGGVSVNAGMNAMENGMYQVIDVSEGGTYVVTLKVKGAEPGYTDVDLFAVMPPKFYNHAAAARYLKELLGCNVDLVQEHKNMRPFFRKQIEADGIRVI